jgi:hypothetical protein
MMARTPAFGVKQAGIWGRLAELYASTFFSDSAMTCVDGLTKNTLGFK